MWCWLFAGYCVFAIASVLCENADVRGEIERQMLDVESKLQKRLTGTIERMLELRIAEAVKNALAQKQPKYAFKNL